MSRARRVLAAGLLAASAPLCGGAAAASPDYAAVRAAHRASDVRVLAADGTEIQRVRRDFSRRQGDWVGMADISPALQHAVIASEDARFFAHGGVDWLALGRAAWQTASTGHAQGASTLSMQLASLLDADLQRQAGGRTLMQKFDQIGAARRLETRWTKSQILEAYLNRVPFRGELVGVDALARVMFQKRAAALNAREAALAAVLLRGPNAPAPVLARRSCALLSELGRPQDCAGMDAVIALALSRGRAGRRGAPDLAPHYARLLLSRGTVPADGIVHSTLWRGLQEQAVASVQRHVRELSARGITDAAVVVLDNTSGAVLAYVGSSGPWSEAPAVDHVRALRQAGSTLKPLLYAMALDGQRITAASLLLDAPLDLDGGGGLYVPGNYDGQYSGWVSARQALASSLNIPAVRVLMMVSPDAFAARLAALGLPLAGDGEYYGYSLALGSADVSLLALGNAYRALAQGGVYTPAGPDAGTDGPGAGRRLYSPEAAWLVGDILSDRQARARTFGLDSPLSTPFWTAVKTGTSRDMRDNWCVGWSRAYTVGVWVGNSAGASMRNVSGVSGAGPIWHELMRWLQAHGQRSVPPAAPAALQRARVRFPAGGEPERAEYFIGDTAQAEFAPPRSADSGTIVADAGSRITEPVDGTIMAIDPDIPFQHQQMRLQAVDAGARRVTGRWFVDGTEIAGERWLPRPGTHRFELRDGQGRVLDHARVHVRSGPYAGAPSMGDAAHSAQGPAGTAHR